MNIDGDELEYTEQGTGEPLVLVHGSASDYRTWHLQQAAFSKHFRTITYSRRYHWPNQPIPDGGDYPMLQHVDDLKKVIHSLDAKPAHLVGHSYGAFLCLLLTLQEPHFVQSLVLAEPPAITLFVSSNPKPLELVNLLVTRPRIAAAIIKFVVSGVAPASRAFKRGDMESGIRKFGEAVFGHGGYDRLSDDRKEQVNDNLSNVKAELLGSGLAPLDPNRVRTIMTPVLLITGEHSVSLFHHIIGRLQKLLPHAERAEIEGASHMMHEDNAPAYNRSVLSFLMESNYHKILI
jgi:pimeloyl-ACP methyl ester carboxylesterase